MTPDLDPDPLNDLGKGILDPAREAKLLADGKVFAAMVIPKDKRVPPFLVSCRRPIVEAAADFFRDAHVRLQAQQQRTSERKVTAPAELVPLAS